MSESLVILTVVALSAIAVAIGLALKLMRVQQSNSTQQNSINPHDHNPNPVIQLTSKGKVLYANEASSPILDFWKVEEGRSLSDDWATMIETGAGAKQVELELVDGQYRCQLVADDKDKTVMLYAYDVSEDKKAVNEALSHSLYDKTTGLANRLLMLDFIKMHIERLSKGQKLYALMIYISDYSELLGVHSTDDINHALNHIKENCQTMFASDASIGRVSDRAFLVVSSEFYNHGQVLSKAQQLLEAYQNPLALDEGNMLIHLCVGISIYPDDTESPDMVLRCAKIAQSRALAEKKLILFYQSGMDEQVQAKRRILVDLHSALKHQELMLYYQPQRSLSKDAYVGAEALIRWKHPERGFISPFFFITAAEESGVIVPIGHWIIENALGHIKQLRKLGLEQKIAINLSAMQFSQESLVQDIVQLCGHYGVAPSNVELEITEGVAMMDLKKAIDKMHQLRSHGFSLAIDDFGTGYSSLSYLKDFPIQKLKIDRAFIKDMDTSKQSYNMTRGIIELGKSLNLNVIAEGAETPQQVELLKQLGCDLVQGYYYSPPVPFEEFVQLLNPKSDLE